MSDRNAGNGKPGKPPSQDYSGLPMMEVSLGDEFRREDTRFPCPAVLTEVLPDDNTYTLQVRLTGQESRDLSVCLLQDLSKTGIGFSCKAPLAIGQTVRLELVRIAGVFEKSLFQFDAEIIRAETSPGDLSPNLYGANAPEKYTIPLIQTAIQSIVQSANKELGLGLRLVKSQT